MPSFTELVRFILDGEEVRAGVANRAPRELDQNIRHLRDVLEAALLGEMVIARDKTIETAAQVGQAVYWNANTHRFERALAGAENDQLTGELQATKATQVRGIVYRKSSSLTADVVLAGRVELDLSAAVDGDITPGLYYLSGSSPGKLVAQRPPVSVAVLEVSQTGSTAGTHEVYVSPKLYDLEGHRHYRFELATVPAGEHTPPAPGLPHEITSPDPAVEGWLPADHAVFDGKAPAGAVFGYNLSVASWRHLWPPLPLASAQLEVFHEGLGTPLAGPVHPELVVLDEHGIWWLTDCRGVVPFDPAYTTGVSASLSASVCPPDVAPRARLWFAKPSYFSRSSVVSSLRGLGAVRVVCRGTDEQADRGDLDIALDLNLLLSDAGQAGHKAVKGIDEEGKLLLGPLVESVKSNSPALSVTSDVADLAGGRKTANLTLALDLSVEGDELPFSDIRLDGTELTYYQQLMALGFPADREATLSLQLRVPHSARIVAGTKLKLYFLLLARAAGNLPAGLFTLSARQQSRPSALLTPQPLVTAFSPLTLDTTATVALNDLIAVESGQLAIAAGDVVELLLTRSGPDAFAGEVQLLAPRGVLVAP